MVGNRFFSYLKPQPPRHLTRVNLFLDFLGRRIQDGTTRASYITPNGYGSRLLMDIIKTADLDTLLLSGDPLHKTGEGLLAIVRDLEKVVDVRVGKSTPRQLFIGSKRPCYELIAPSRRANPLWEIPYTKPYTHPDWVNVRPLRIVEMGPCDLTFRVFNDRLDYSRQGPPHALYTIDCFALVTKFIAYYRAQPQVLNLDQAILDYLHGDVIIPTLLNDSVALWMRNIYQQQLMTASPLESHNATFWDTMMVDTLGSDFTGAMVDVQHLKTDLENQSITDLVALSSLLITPDRQSVTEYYNQLHLTTQIPDQQPWVWFDCLKNLGWWTFILTTMSYGTSLSDSISFQRSLARDVRLWTMMRPWQEIPSSVPYKNAVRARLEALYDYLMTK